MERKEIESKLKELRNERSVIEDEITRLEEQQRNTNTRYHELVGKYFRYNTTSPENSWKNGAVIYVFAVQGKRHFTNSIVVKCAAAYPSTGSLCSLDTFSFEAFALEEISRDEFTRTLLSITDAIIEETDKENIDEAQEEIYRFM